MSYSILTALKVSKLDKDETELSDDEKEIVKYYRAIKSDERGKLRIIVDGKVALIDFTGQDKLNIS